LPLNSSLVRAFDVNKAESYAPERQRRFEQTAMIALDLAILNSDQFIERDGRLQYIAARRTTVIVASAVGTP
jgi:hypothetical protein